MKRRDFSKLAFTTAISPISTITNLPQNTEDKFVPDMSKWKDVRIAVLPTQYCNKTIRFHHSSFPPICMSCVDFKVDVYTEEQAYVQILKKIEDCYKYCKDHKSIIFGLRRYDKKFDYFVYRTVERPCAVSMTIMHKYKTHSLSKSNNTYREINDFIKKYV